MTQPAEVGGPLDRVRSIKVKLGVLVVASVTITAVVATIGARGGVAAWLTIPVTVVLALALTQLLASGMTLPLREMTGAARRMAQGDYTQRVRATAADEVGTLARAFNRMADDLATTDEQRRDLIANVSHELRTPVAALGAALDNLADGVVEPTPEALDAARRQTERVSGLLTDLLDLSRVEAGLVELDLQQLRVRRVLDDAVEEASRLGRGVSYAVEVEPTSLTVTADERRLRQVVGNLLDNAARHSPAGGTVRVAAALVGEGTWRLEVADEGPGIAREERARVFQRYGTGADATSGGTGLGLAIARWAVGLHGGWIAVVDPAPGARGARVRVELPVQVTTREPAMSGSGMSGPGMSGPGKSSSAGLEPRTVTSQPADGRPEESETRPPGPLPAARGQGLLDELFGDAWPRPSAPRGGLLLACLASGLLAGITIPDRMPGLGYLLVVLLGGTTIFVASRYRNDRFMIACAALALVLATSLVLRDAAWLQALCILAAVTVGLAGLVRANTVAGFVLAGLAWPVAMIRSVPWAGRVLRGLSRTPATPAVVRTVLWSVLGVVAFGLLFGSADALLAQWFDTLLPDLSIDGFADQGFVAGAITLVVLGAVYLGLAPPRVDLTLPARAALPNRYEWLVPVLLVDAVFVVWLAAQATAFFGGHAYLERTTGLTYAEYVHQGFGQLTVATALTLVVVWLAQRRASRADATDRMWLRIGLGALCAMTLVVVGSALYRMHLYQEAYGFTRLRVVVDVFEIWLGLIVLGVIIAGVRLRGTWLPRAALLGGAALVAVLLAMNPDAWIAQRNVDRYAATGNLDLGYLSVLSADAAPVLATLPSDVRVCVLSAPDEVDDLLGWNLGRSRAYAFTDGLPAQPPDDCPSEVHP